MNFKLTLAIMMLILALVSAKGGWSGHWGRHGGHSRGRGGHSRGGYYGGESYEDDWYDSRRIRLNANGDGSQWSNSESND